jgi:hypothetical protein
MRAWVYLLIAVLVGSLSITRPAKSEEVSQNPTGQWQSVDYVQNIADFKPGIKQWRDELFLKEVEFRNDGTTTSFVRWENGWLLHEDGKTKAQYYIKQIGNATYMFFPWLSGDVTIRGEKPRYYVLKKVSNGGQTGSVRRLRLANIGASRAIEIVNSVKPYDDVRDKNLSKLGPETIANIIATLDFNRDTIWPNTSPAAANRQKKLLEGAMNPGLHVRRLHREGVTGRGVNVAIIDQPLYQDHPEFAGKIAEYFDTGCKSESSMHGPAVTSLLVGTNCGTAPDAKVYYAAAPSWLKDTAYQAKALDWIVEQNAKLPAGEKIRVVSVSAAPSGQGTPFEKNQQMWDEACARAEAAGILVLDCTMHHGFIGSCWLDTRRPEDVASCSPGYPGLPTTGVRRGNLLVPTSPRTVAEEYDKGQCSYQYNGRGGQSWAIPYAAGVLAMGWQIKPDLTAEQMKKLLFDSAYTNPAGLKIINPSAFIAAVKKTR